MVESLKADAVTKNDHYLWQDGLLYDYTGKFTDRLSNISRIHICNPWWTVLVIYTFIATKGSTVDIVTVMHGSLPVRWQDSNTLIHHLTPLPDPHVLASGANWYDSFMLILWTTRRFLVVWNTHNKMLKLRLWICKSDTLTSFRRHISSLFGKYINTYYHIKTLRMSFVWYSNEPT